MNITTKFDVGQTVWIMFNNQPEQWKVEEIILSNITNNHNQPMPQYRLRFIGQDHGGTVHEVTLWQYQVHATKRELLMSFLTDNDL